MNAGADGLRPIRVLHLRDSPWVDGPGRTIIESGRHFDRCRIDYHIGIFVGSAEQEHPMAAVATMHALSVHKIVDRGGVDLNAVMQIVALVDRLRIQVLHTSDFRSRMYGLLVHLRRPHLTLVTTVHGWIANTRRRRLVRFLDKVLLRHSRIVVMVSDATRSLVPRWWLPQGRVAVLRNAIVIEEYGVTAGTSTSRNEGPRSSTRILNVGRLSEEKGQDLLIRAVADLAGQYEGLELLIAGRGPCEGALRELAGRLGLNDRVHFLGYVEDMPALYAEVDLVVQSSLTEGLPNVILEAAHLGLPIIATDVGGTREVIEHGTTGWLIAPGSVPPIADALRSFMERRDEFVGMASRARDRIEQEFSFAVRTTRMMRIYEGLME